MKQEKIHILSLLAALVASVIFGMSFMCSKLALAVAQPSVLLAFRFTLAVAAMTLVIAVNALVGKLRGRKLFAFDLYHKPVGKLVLLGLVQPVAYFIFENYGILYTSSAVAGTIIAAVPVCCILMDVLVLHERVTVRQVLCALGAVGGVALISVGGAVMISALGLLFLLLTMLSDSVYYGVRPSARNASRNSGMFTKKYSTPARSNPVSTPSLEASSVRMTWHRPYAPPAYSPWGTINTLMATLISSEPSSPPTSRSPLSCISFVYKRSRSSLVRCPCTGIISAGTPIVKAFFIIHRLYSKKCRSRSCPRRRHRDTVDLLMPSIAPISVMGRFSKKYSAMISCCRGVSSRFIARRRLRFSRSRRWLLSPAVSRSHRSSPARSMMS